MSFNFLLNVKCTQAHTHIRKKVLHIPFKTRHGAPGYFIHISDEKKNRRVRLKRALQSGQCMTSKYRESQRFCFPFRGIPEKMSASILHTLVKNDDLSVSVSPTLIFVYEVRT